MKKLFILIMLFLSPICCYAEDGKIYNEDVYYDIIDGDVFLITRSYSFPTSGVDLSIMSYKVNISNVGNSWYYSNAYFTVASNKRIVINYSLSSDGGSATVGLYDMTSNSWVGQKNGFSGSLTVNNLNTSHKYVVGIKSSNASYVVNGFATVTC